MSVIKPHRLEISPENLQYAVLYTPCQIVPAALLFWADWLSQPVAIEKPVCLGDERKVIRCEPLEQPGMYRVVAIYQFEDLRPAQAVEMILDFSSLPDFDPEQIKQLIKTSLMQHHPISGFVEPELPVPGSDTNSAEGEPPGQR